MNTTSRIITLGLLIPLSIAVAQPVEPKPFERGLTVGYLLNYNFLSPRPYCWPAAESPLSGWEVDKRGGNWACHPTCHYPEGFAFHSDWFKLVDTNRAAAVTIKHQIARQTAGPITLEFRFKLPASMEGACWQLRDLKEACVSLITSDRNLAYESAAGQPVVLQAYEAGHDYGVKVVADITRKTAELYVDGVLKAKDAPFCRPVNAIDYVLIKTSDSGTGEMFLGPVNVYKGYAVNETFVTTGIGRVPSDWEVESGVVKVEPFECATKPDIFSLKLSGRKEDVAVANRRFSPIQGKTVFAYRFLLPQKQDGAGVELLNSDRKAGLKLVTANGNLCLVDPNRPPLPLVRAYRSNLWYMVKVVADPKTGTAQICVNGKTVAERATFPGEITEFSALRLASPTLMWVDDVAVSPWQDYPADYVPEPKPALVKNGYLLGAQSCNLWREGNAYAGWDYVYPYRAQRKPALGWYGEGHPEEVDWEIKWQVEHGIGFEMHCWYRPNNAINHPIKDGVLDQGIVKGLFHARYSHLTKFAIMCTDEGACETNMDDFQRHIIPYWIEYFFKDPRYLKLEGKPVLSIYHLGHLQRMFGGTENARKAIQMLRDEVAKAGFPGLLVLMEDRTCDPNTLRGIKSVGADYCYSYTWFTRDASEQRKKSVAQRGAAVAAGLDLLPSISMGWDREAWGVHDGGWVPVADYKALARWARDEFMPSLPTDSLGRRILMLANWNEFGEGHFLMPSSLAGFGYLDALRDVFAQDSPHEDLTPTDRQKRRFTVLYPKD